MTQTTPCCRITLQRLELDVFLGWPAAERAAPQPISIDITLRFDVLPKACLSDDLKDTYCYDTLVSHLRGIVSAKPFRLLEHLGQVIYQAVKQAVPTANVSIDIKKLPPIPHLAGGVTFSIGD